MKPISFLGAALILAASYCNAQSNYPDRPIRLVVPFEPGGTTDVLTRVLTPSLAKTLGQPIVVENRAGGSATIGAAHVVKSAPDGYTFLVGASDTVTSKYIIKGIQYDAETQLEMVSRFAWSPYLILANSSVPANDIPSLSKLAKERKDGLTYSSAGIGTIPHLAGARFAMNEGIQMLHIPMKGTAPAVNEVISGRVDLVIVGLASCIEHIKSGRMKAIAVASDKRLPFFPDAPTIVEAGGKPLTSGSWFAILAPAKTPMAIQEKIAAALKVATEDPEVQKTYATLGAIPVQETPAVASKSYKQEFKDWKVVLDKINLD